MQGPDEVPGVVLPVSCDHAAGGDYSVAHPLQPIEYLHNDDVVTSIPPKNKFPDLP